MTLLEFIAAPGNVAFSVSGVFLLLLVLVEVLGVISAGMGISHVTEMFDAKSHDFDVSGFAADAMGYLHWGKVPAIVIITALTGLFTLGGFGVQSLSLALVGTLMPAWLASFPAGAVSLIGTHWLAKPLARLMPTDSSDAITRKDLLGMVGIVSVGPVYRDHPGEARVRDLKGGIHLVRIESRAEVPIAVGHEIVLSGINGPFYEATSIEKSIAAVGNDPSSLPDAAVDGAETKSSVHVHQEK